MAVETPITRWRCIRAVDLETKRFLGSAGPGEGSPTRGVCSSRRRAAPSCWAGELIPERVGARRYM